MSARVGGVSDEEATGLAKEILDANTLLFGRTANAVRILAAHSPFVARWVIGLAAAVRQPNMGAFSDVRLRNLANIKTSMTNDCNYCATHTSIFAQGLGLGEAELETLRTDAYRESQLFDDREKAVIRWAESVTKNTAKQDREAWNEMRRNFTDAEIVEITLAAAMFNMMNRLNDSLWTELEPEEHNRLQSRANNGTVDQLEAFAGRFATTGAAEREARSAREISGSPG